MNIKLRIRKLLAADSPMDLEAAVQSLETSYLMPLLYALEDETNWTLPGEETLETHLQAEDLSTYWHDIANLERWVPGHPPWFIAQDDEEAPPYDSRGIELAYELACKLWTHTRPPHPNGITTWKEQEVYLGNLQTSRVKEGLHLLGENWRKLDAVAPAWKGRIAAKSLFPSLANAPAQPKLSPQDKLAEFLWWYDVDAADTGRRKLALGIQLAKAAIAGDVALRRIFPAADLCEIVRFRHPKHNASDDWFSYALLLQVGGTMGSDWSMWYLFPEVGGDYAGLGGQVHFEMESLLNQFAAEIHVREYKISLNRLLHYIEEHGPGLSWQRKDMMPALAVEAHVEEYRQNYRSLLLEFVAERFLRRMPGISSTGSLDSKLPGLNNGEEVDAYAFNDPECKTVLIECKLSFASAGDLRSTAERASDKTRRVHEARFGAKGTYRTVVAFGVRHTPKAEEVAKAGLDTSDVDILWLEDLDSAVPKKHGRDRFRKSMGW